MSQVNQLSSHHQARSKLIQVFRYVQAFNHLQNPVQQEIQEQPWVLWLQDLPDHPCIRLGTAGNTDQSIAPSQNSADENFILKISRPKQTDPPDPPKEIMPWLQNGWQNIDGHVALDTTKSQSFPENSRLKQLFDAWVAKRTKWVEVEQSARQALKYFNRLYELRAQLEREAERLELMLGDGIISWYPKEGKPLHHPILLIHLQLHFDPQVPEFTLTETDQSPELYTPLFQALPDINAINIRSSRQDFEQHQCHPLNGDETSQFFQRLINQLSPYGEFSLTTVHLKDKSIPSITRAPVIFLRNRTLGFNTALETILEDLVHRPDLPHALINLVGIETIGEKEDETTASLLDSLNGEDEHILLSKPANAEQLEVARRLEKNGAVLVQGPPGTGKTHTIANLLGHFLAQGKSVLVTSHASKALKVLRDKVVEPLQPLCVSIMEDDNRKQMERAIDAITERLAFANASALEREAAKLTQRRIEIISQLRKARKELKEARQFEYQAIVFAGQQYTPSQAARDVAERREEISWLPSPITLGVPLPLSSQELIDLYHTNKTVSDKDEQEMILGLPNMALFPLPEDFLALTSKQAQLQKEDLQYRRELWEQAPKTSSPTILKELQGHLTLALKALQDQPYWRLAAIAAGREGGLRRQVWDDLIAKIEGAYNVALQAQPSLLEHDPDVSDSHLSHQSETILDEIIAHLTQNKKIHAFTLFTHRNWKNLIEGTSVQGRAPESLEHFIALRSLLHVQFVREDLIRRWQKQMTPLGGPDAIILGPQPEQVCLQYVYQLRQCLEWYSTIWLPLEQRIKDQGILWDNLLAEMPINHDEYGDILRLCEAAQVALPSIIAAEINRLHYASNIAALRTIEQQIASITGSAAKTAAVRQLYIAVTQRNAQGYKASFERLVDLQERQSDLQRRHMLLAKLEKAAPNWAVAIRHRDGIHGEPTVPPEPEEAWRWKQLNDELDRRSKVSLEDLQARITQLSKSLENITIELVEKKAWAAQVRRTTLEQRQALQGWKELIRKVGKGTGKRAPRLLAEARRLMPICQTAVPVWIMPLSRIVQNFDPRRNRFDVVIIDEASQADIKALTAIYMGQQIVVVGDDEQVTPLAVGQRIDQTDKLIDEHLQDIRNSSLYDGKLSIYSLARTTFRPVCLQEHFRCVSPIIQFSNHLSYAGKIKPLRDDSEVVRRPATVAYRADSAETIEHLNKEEALTITSLLVAATEQPEYHDATFGVITMVSDKQPLYIDMLLRQYLSETTYTRRQLLCGNPAQFQGDERDIIFLSMVDTSPDNGPLPLRSEEAQEGLYKKRFNVAASRARDQLWVVHSLDPTTHLKDGDIRKRLILHASNPQAFSSELAEQEKKVDSEFEKQVLRRLMQAGYRVIPQWPVGAYRIDLVVEGGGKRLAVECDGERWHRFDNLEADMARQAILERLGWRFERIRGSLFFRRPDQAMAPIFARLQALEIAPEGMKHDAHASQQDGWELKERIIRRATELRQRWIASNEGSYVQSTNSSPSTKIPSSLGISSKRQRSTL